VLIRYEIFKYIHDETQYVEMYLHQVMVKQQNVHGKKRGCTHKNPGNNSIEPLALKSETATYEIPK